MGSNICHKFKLFTYDLRMALSSVLKQVQGDTHSGFKSLRKVKVSEASDTLVYCTPPLLLKCDCTN